MVNPGERGLGKSAAVDFPLPPDFIKSGGCCGGEQWFGIISGDTHKEIW